MSLSGSAVREDGYGLPVTAASEAAAERLRAAQVSILSQAVDPGSLLEDAIRLDDDFGMAHAALALVRFREMRILEAKVASAKASELLASALPRERSHAAIVATAVEGRGAEAIDQMRAHLETWPRDALLLSNLSSALLFSGRQDEMLDVTSSVEHAYGDDWYFLGQHAFALEEMRRYPEARAAAERSLAQMPAAAFSVHALAHVFYETGAHGEGAAFMPGWMAGYDRRAGMHLHLSWHQALFLLARGEYTSLLDLYEREIRPEARPGSFQLFDQVSLLWRLDLYAGGGRTPLWAGVDTLAAERSRQPSTTFNDLHHGMALAAAGLWEEFSGICSSLAERGARGNVIAGEVALPLLQGIGAYARGEYAAAVRLIEPVEARIHLVGGSKAQREVFHDTLLEAYLRSDHFAEAEQRIRERLDRRPSPRDFYRLGRLQVGAGHDGARQSLNRALAEWPAADAGADEIVAARSLHRSLAA